MTASDCPPSRLPEFLRDLGVPVSTRLASRWTPVDRWRMHSRSSAERAGAPFLLVHGLVISSLYMIPLAECLAASAEVHALDLPGFGRSTGPRSAPPVPALADFIEKWMTAAGVERCHIVGNSLGCQVVADFAARYPARVGGVVLIGLTIDPAAHSVPRQALRLACDMIREPPRLWLNHVVDYARALPRRWFTLLHAMFSDRIAEKLPRISAPTLVLRGAADTIAPQDWAERAAQLVPNGRAAIISGAVHCPHYTHPVETARQILAFTSGIEPGEK